MQTDILKTTLDELLLISPVELKKRIEVLEEYCDQVAEAIDRNISDGQTQKNRAEHLNKCRSILKVLEGRFREIGFEFVTKIYLSKEYAQLEFQEEVAPKLLTIEDRWKKLTEYMAFHPEEYQFKETAIKPILGEELWKQFNKFMVNKTFSMADDNVPLYNEGDVIYFMQQQRQQPQTIGNP